MFHFLQSYIPKTLDHVKNVEKDVIQITSGKDTGDLYYKTITGLKEALPKVQSSPADQQQQDANTIPVEGSSVDGHSNSQESESEAESASGSETDGDEENSSGSDRKGPSSDNVASVDKKAARKENKKKVKEEKREARKTKVPKALKKRKKKLDKAHKTR